MAKSAVCKAVIAVMNFEFMAGSMGVALGEGLLAAARLALHAGGARSS